ncbi:MAG TPA: hypothetical protein VF711_00300, partial [Acidimicrobiales bacterium]
MQDVRATPEGGLLDDDLRSAIESEAAGYATAPQLALLEGNRPQWREGLRRLLNENQTHLASIRNLPGPERDQVVADFEQERAQLLASLRRLDNAKREGPNAPVLDGPGELRLQASWSEPGTVVVWAAGPGTAVESADEVSDRLERSGAPAHGWAPHPPVRLPSGDRAPAHAIQIADALGWLVAVGGG